MADLLRPDLSTFGVTGADSAAPRWLAAAFGGFPADWHGETVKNVTCSVDPIRTANSNMLGNMLVCVHFFCPIQFPESKGHKESMR